MEFNAQNAVKEVIENQLNEVGVELEENVKTAVFDFMVSNRILTVKRIVDLGEFVHYRTERQPKKTLILNEFLVYVYSDEIQVRYYDNDYEVHLEENDLYEDEFSYQEFLDSRSLVDNGTTQERHFLEVHRVGDVLFGAVKSKKHLEEELQLANDTLDKIKPVVNEHFVKGLEL